jgi:hypothetical protein
MIFCQNTLPGSQKQKQELEKKKKKLGVGVGGRSASYKTTQKYD